MASSVISPDDDVSFSITVCLALLGITSIFVSPPFLPMAKSLMVVVSWVRLSIYRGSPSMNCEQLKVSPGCILLFMAFITIKRSLPRHEKEQQRLGIHATVTIDPCGSVALSICCDSMGDEVLLSTLLQ